MYDLEGMDLLKTVTGKVVAGAVALAVIAGGISWWRMDEATRQMLLALERHRVVFESLVFEKLLDQLVPGV